MKKLKTKHYVIAAVVVVIVIVVAVCLLWPKNGGEVDSTGSGIIENSSREENSEVDTEVLEAVENEMTIIEIAMAEEETANYIKKMDSLRSYEVIKAEEKEDGIYATLCFSVPDLYTIVKELAVEGELTEEILDAALTDAINEDTLIPMEVTVPLYEENGELKMEITRDFLDAYYGGVLRIQEEYYEEVLGGTGDEE